MKLSSENIRRPPHSSIATSKRPSTWSRRSPGPCPASSKIHRPSTRRGLSQPPHRDAGPRHQSPEPPSRARRVSTGTCKAISALVTELQTTSRTPPTPASATSPSSPPPSRSSTTRSPSTAPSATGPNSSVRTRPPISLEGILDEENNTDETLSDISDTVNTTAANSSVYTTTDSTHRILSPVPRGDRDYGGLRVPGLNASADRWNPRFSSEVQLPLSP